MVGRVQPTALMVALQAGQTETASRRVLTRRHSPRPTGACVEKTENLPGICHPAGRDQAGLDEVPHELVRT